MTKPPIGLIADALNIERGLGSFEAERAAESCLAALNAAGFVILPREPTEAMTDSPDYVAGNWSRRNWEAILRSAGLSGKDAR